MGSGRAGGRSVFRSLRGSGAVWGSGLLSGASRATQVALGAPGEHPAVLSDSGGQGESISPPVDELCRGFGPVGLVALAGTASDTGPVAQGGVPGGGCFAGAGLPPCGLKKVPTRTGPRCAPSASNPC